MNENKIIGAASVFLGIICVGFIFYYGGDRLVDSNSDAFISKYFVLIMFLTGGMYFLLLGFMVWSGKIVPYYKADKIERAKHHYWGALITTPFFISTSWILISSASMKWKIVGVMFFAFYVYLLISGRNTLKQRNT